jgi:hypothetical protein
MASISGISSRLKEPAAVFGLYALLAVALHHQGFFGSGDCTLGDSSLDKHLHLWDFWWAWRAFTAPDTSFFEVTWVFYPPGVSLWQGNSGFLLSYFTVPIRWLTGDAILTYNLTILSSLWMTCVGGYWLTRSLVGHRGAAFCAGAILAFNPLVAFQINAGYVEYLNLGFAALFVLSTVKMIDEGGLRNTLLSCLWLYLAMTWAWYMGVFLMLFAGLWFAFRCRTIWTRLRAWSTARDLVIWTLGIGLFALAVYGNVRNPVVHAERAAREERFLTTLDDIDRIVIDPSEARPEISFKVLDADGEELYREGFPIQWLELKIMNSVDPTTVLTKSEHPTNQGYYFFSWLIPILLVGAALFELRRARVRFLFGAAAAFLLLALGPCMIFGGEVYLNTFDWMPYSLLSAIVPGVDRIQFPNRFLVAASFALVPLAAFGLRRIAERRWAGPRARLLLYPLVIGGLALSYLNDLDDSAMACEEIAVPQIYRTLAADDDDYAIIEVPFDRGLDFRDHKLPAYVFSTYQTIHGKRRLTGHIPGFLAERHYPEDIRQSVLLDALEAWSLYRVDTRSTREPPSDVDVLGRARLLQDIEVLRKYGFRTIIVHDWVMPMQPYQGVTKLLIELLGPPDRDESTWDRVDIYHLEPRR